ncbi:MAG: LysE family translocator [Leucobacter sp.]
MSALGLTDWATLLIVWIAAVASPGPDVFLLLRLAVRSRKSAVYAALGIMTGNALWILFSVLGIAVLLVALPWLLPVLQIAGALVLGYLGVQSIRGGVSGLRRPHVDAEVTEPRRTYILGFVTNIANPKVLIFFTALLSQFLPPQATAIDRLLVIVVMVVSGLVWFVGVAVACSARRFRHWFRHAAPWLDIVAGAVFLLVAAVVLIELIVGS